MRFKFIVLLFLISLSLVTCHLKPKKLQSNNPQANPKAVVVQDNARFTVLTERLFRLEWSPVKVFQDNATFAFLNRNLPVPNFTTTLDNGWLVITTNFVELRYMINTGTSFNSSNLLITYLLNGKKQTWKMFGDYTIGNLYGTARTLDTTDGGLDLECKTQLKNGLHCTYGLVSRSGIVVVDDSGTPPFDDGKNLNGYSWVVNRTFPQASNSECQAIAHSNRRDCGYYGISDAHCLRMGCCVDTSLELTSPRCFYGARASQDLYIFAHGRDYTAALYDFTQVSGKVPIPPRFSFGVFFSRYWAYNDIESMNIVQEYEQRAIPLDVLVTDMDWHLTFYRQADSGVTDQAGQRIGWSGFTWDPNLFPDPKGFLNWCKSKGLKNTLNLHPASGIQPWEEKYSEMASIMGIDPTTNKYVPFSFTDPKFITNFFDVVLQDINQQGIDFWWLDWQQGEDGWIDIARANPTFWLNYLFFTYPNQWANGKRPVLLHRWGGLGNHRYQIGFSGDVVPSWDSLNFQPYFTSRAANVAYGYWSHDLGGHTAPSPPELYTRWVQWGAFSPIFRTHCTKNANNDRRIWTYPAENYEIMRDAMLLRSSLVPYLYSSARITYDTGISVVSPLYYKFPESDEAYQDQFNTQYFFGDQIMVSPVTSPLNQSTSLATKNIWIPPGTWIEWFSGQALTGPRVLTASYTLDEIPVFIKSGAILPVAPESTNSIGQAQVIPQTLRLLVFPPASMNIPFTSSYSLYEDDGVSQDYQNGVYSNTTFTFSASEDSSNLNLVVQVNPVEGVYEGMPDSRSYEIYLVGFLPPDKLQANGKEITYQQPLSFSSSSSSPSWTYEGETLTVKIVNLPEVNSGDSLTVKLSVPKPGFDVSGLRKKARRLQKVKTLLDNQWGIKTVYQSDFTNILGALEIPRKLTYNPSDASSLLTTFRSVYKAALNESRYLAAAPDIQLQVYSMLAF